MNYNCDLGHKSDKQLWLHKLHVYLINPEENLKIYSKKLYQLGLFFSFQILTCMGNTITTFIGMVICKSEWPQFCSPGLYAFYVFQGTMNFKSYCYFVVIYKVV